MQTPIVKQIRSVLIVILLLSVFFSLGDSLRAADHTVQYPEYVPEILWCRGCTPTSASMALGYWDNYSGGGIYNGSGRLIDYWQDLSQYSDGTGSKVNVPNILEELRIDMGTDVNGGTWTSAIGPGIKSVANNRNSYSYNSVQCYGGSQNDYCWETITGEISNNRPFVWSVGINNQVGHSLCAWGYTDSKYVIVYNTWNYGREDWYYTKYDNGPNTDWQYVDTVEPGGWQGDNQLALDQPRGGETLVGGQGFNVRWYHWGSLIDTVTLYYSTDGGNTWTSIATSVGSSAGWNGYLWRVPNVTSGKVRVKINGFDNTAYIAGDGTKSNLAVLPDTIPPNNPTGCTETHGVVSSVWQNTVDTPAFAWNGASDGSGSAVKGYYWYFGDNLSADPATWTATAGCNPSAVSSGTYYLRVKTEDNAGNRSSPVTLFIFKYDGIMPADGILNGTANDRQIALSWNGFSDSGGSGLRGTDTYKVVRNTGTPPSMKCTNGTQVYLGNGNSATDPGLSNGTQYFYRICAYDSAGNVSAGATINATPTSGTMARVEIDHANRADLVVTVGRGNVNSPSWSKVVSNRSGSGANIYADVDISGGVAYLPPSGSNVWFLKVSDQRSGSTGTIKTFRITHQGQTYNSTNPPVSIRDNQTSYAYIRGPTVPYTLTLASLNPNSGVPITISPNDNGGQGNGSTQFTRTYNSNTVVTLTAPGTAGGNTFQKWQRDGVDYGTRVSTTVTMNANRTMTAVYGSPPPSGAMARVEIDHTYRGDLVVTVGVGNVSSPSWSKVVSNRSGGSADNLYVDVDLSGGSAYLPPDGSKVWFLKVSDQAYGDTGTIRTFRITYQGQTFSSTDPPVSVRDNQTSYAYIR
jgi:subtilisin-like proprotein convertase family protein